MNNGKETLHRERKRMDKGCVAERSYWCMQGRETN